MESSVNTSVTRRAVQATIEDSGRWPRRSLSAAAARDFARLEPGACGPPPDDAAVGDAANDTARGVGGGSAADLALVETAALGWDAADAVVADMGVAVVDPAADTVAGEVVPGVASGEVAELIVLKDVCLGGGMGGDEELDRAIGCTSVVFGGIKGGGGDGEAGEDCG